MNQHSKGRSLLALKNLTKGHRAFAKGMSGFLWGQNEKTPRCLWHFGSGELEFKTAKIVFRCKRGKKIGQTL